MRKIVMMAVVLFATTLMAAEIHWAKDFKSGVAEASKAGKPILFIFSRHTCKYCRILEQEVLQKNDVATALNRDFVSIISYSDDGDYTPAALWRPGTPTIWFLKSNGEPMYQPLMGALPKETFLKALAIVKTEFDKQNKK